MAREALLASARAVPARLLDGGFTYRYPTLEAALAHELQHRGSAARVEIRSAAQRRCIRRRPARGPARTVPMEFGASNRRCRPDGRHAQVPAKFGASNRRCRPDGRRAQSRRSSAHQGAGPAEDPPDPACRIREAQRPPACLEPLSATGGPPRRRPTPPAARRRPAASGTPKTLFADFRRRTTSPPHDMAFKLERRQALRVPGPRPRRFIWAARPTNSRRRTGPRSAWASS